MSRFFFIGNIYPEDFKKEIMELGSGVQFSSDTFQHALLDGLKEHFPQMQIYTAPPVSSFPQIKKLWFGSREWKSPFNDLVHWTVSFVNIPGLKVLSKCFSFGRIFRRHRLFQSGDTVLMYSVQSSILLPCRLHKAKGSRLFLLVTDLPEYMSDSRNILYRAGKWLDRRLINWGLKAVDGYILLSPAMKERLPVGDKPCIVMEGIFNPQQGGSSALAQQSASTRNILYTGKLDARFGILDLVEAFKRVLGGDLRLVVCGYGDAAQQVQAAAKEDQRIDFRGIVSHEEVLQLQRSATLLVNPRHSSDDYVRYSFPSKTMEYMASGTPTMMCRLECLTEEYLEHLLIFEDESVEGMARKIRQTLEMPEVELRAKGRKAAKFILRCKSSKVQGARVADFLNQ